MDYDVIVYGTVCLDLLWRVESLPPPGGYVDILEERTLIGGEAANTAIALDRWGVRVALVGNPIGNDAHGRLLREQFLRYAPGIDLRFVASSDTTETPYCVCMSTPDGQRTMFGHRFADLECPPLTRELSRSAKWFTAEPNALSSGITACIAASEAGMKVVPMDFAKVPEVNAVSEIVLTSSEHVGRSLAAPELMAFAGGIRDMAGPTTIVTHGENGCYLAERATARVIHVPAYQAPATVDTTGAGDVFRAGLLYGLVNDRDIHTAIRFGSAAAAMNCDSMGAWSGVRSVEEIQRFQTAAA